jgi:hypothetical protein
MFILHYDDLTDGTGLQRVLGTVDPDKTGSIYEALIAASRVESILAQIVAKSSAVRGRVTLPPLS